MLELNDDYFECNECTGDFILSPPKFNLPPPPIPPKLRNSVNCENYEDILKLMKNWDNNLLDISDLYESTNFTSSLTARNLAVLGLFTVILTLALIVSGIYFKRFFEQKTQNLKNLEKCRTIIKPKANIDLNNKNHYDECNYSNNYTISIPSTRQDYVGYEQIDYYCKNQEDVRPPIPIPQKDLLKYDWPTYYNEATMMLILQKEQEEQRSKNLPILFPQHYESQLSPQNLRMPDNLQYSTPYECFHHNYPPTAQIELNNYCCCNSGNVVTCGNHQSSCCANSGSGDSGITICNGNSCNEFRIEMPRINNANYMETNLVTPSIR